MRRTVKPTALQPAELEIDGIPTAAGLVAQGLAKRVQHRAGTFVTISPEGHRLIGEKMRERAEAFRVAGMHRGPSGVHPEAPKQPGM